MHVRNHHSPSICFLVLVIAIAASCETAIAQGANSESSAKTSGEWPTGAGGDVMVALGQVVTIPAGSVLDLTSLTVQFGGTLQIERGSGWTIIGCTGDITLQGTIVGVTCDKPYGLITASAPDNVLRYYYAITSGGNGGGAGASIRSKGGAGSIMAMAVVVAPQILQTGETHLKRPEAMVPRIRVIKVISADPAARVRRVWVTREPTAEPPLERRSISLTVAEAGAVELTGSMARHFISRHSAAFVAWAERLTFRVVREVTEVMEAMPRIQRHPDDQMAEAAEAAVPAERAEG